MSKEVEPLLNTNLFPDQGFADPHAMVVNDRLYVICGHDQSMQTTDTWRMDRWEILSTDDLRHWRKEGRIEPTDTYIGNMPNCWAGDNVMRGDKYYWYFSNKNIDTGVMVADQPTGPYVDALNKPLLPNNIIEGTPYDPAVFEEDGKYTIFFGSGLYYAAELNEDMISLKEAPVPIIVKDEVGNCVRTDDKSTVFRRGEWYYLVWGSKYAMSHQLKGPYEYKGAFIKSHHNSVFKWGGKWYLMTEMEATTIFYRSICMKEITFHENGMVIIPEDDWLEPYNGRQWKFEHSDMGWHGIDGAELTWSNLGNIQGTAVGKTAIESVLWPTLDLNQFRQLSVSLRSTTNLKLRIKIATAIREGAFWDDRTEINWEQVPSIDIPVKSSAEAYISYQMTLPETVTGLLKQIRMEFIDNNETYIWSVDSLIIS